MSTKAKTVTKLPSISIKNPDALKSFSKHVSQIEIDYDRRNLPDGAKKFNQSIKKGFGYMKKAVSIDRKLFKDIKKPSVKVIVRNIVYILLSITIIAITNTVLIEKMIDAYQLYIAENPDFKQKNLVVGLQGYVRVLGRKLNEVSVLRRVLIGTIFVYTIVEIIPQVIEKRQSYANFGVVKMFKTLVENLVKFESNKVFAK